MNILTFDIEDWYNCDFISQDFNWSKFEVRIYDGVNRILDELDRQDKKGTFFCLGWLAENHPGIIREIYDRGHQIGCHSYQHELSYRFTVEEFIADTAKAKKLIEDVIGVKINSFRAPGFSITKDNTWALERLAEMGFKYDCSIFPAPHDYGGMPLYGAGVPKIIELKGGLEIKEFPINIYRLFGKNLVFSGGGFFRLFPYFLIRYFTNRSNYVMTYFHPRDFDFGQPIVQNLPLARRFKSYVGIKSAFKKFHRYLSEYKYYNVEQADKIIDWSKVERIHIDKL